MRSGVSFSELCRHAFHVGATAYGGPAMLASVKARFVDRTHAVSERELFDAVALAQLLPGSTSVSVLTAIGFRRRGLAGAILLPACFLLPAFLLMSALSWAYFRYGSIPAADVILTGLGPVVTALLIHATLSLARPAMRGVHGIDYRAVLLAVSAFMAVAGFRVDTVAAIVVCGIAGTAFHYLAGGFVSESVVKDHGVDMAYAPAGRLRRRFSYPLWFGVAAFVAASLLTPSVTRLTGTFLNIGTYAFGGGYAAIPLMKSLVVDQFGWLTLREFTDGIALGQVTPGPVFITATFIGYRVGGLLGAASATAAVFFTPVAAMLLVLRLGAKAQALSPVRAFTRGVVAGCIGLFAALTVQFAMGSLTGPVPAVIAVLSLVAIARGINPVVAVAGSTVLTALLGR